jgi:transcriptional regulator with XRE-family HTH domain
MTEPAGGSPVFAERLSQLFEHARRPDGKEWSALQVAKAVSATGVATSHQYVSQLRSGERNNPRFVLVEALAAFFAVPVSYFADNSVDDTLRKLVDPSAGIELRNLRRLVATFLLIPEAEQEQAINTLALRVAGQLDQPVDAATYASLPYDVARHLEAPNGE